MDVVNNEIIIDESIIALKKGFNLIVSEYELRYFTPDDVQKLTCGDHLIFKKFIDCCQFYDKSIEEVFTDVVSKFSQNELKKLLHFITGSQSLPFGKYIIKIEYKKPGYKTDERNYPLPIAHTCFGIEICPFKNSNILADKLKLAMLTEMITDSDLSPDLLSFD